MAPKLTPPPISIDGELNQSKRESRREGPAHIAIKTTLSRAPKAQERLREPVKTIR